MKEVKKSFETAIAELEGVVQKLEKGELTLDASIDAFQQGIELTKYCNKRLDEVEKKISLLIETDNGELLEKNFPGLED
jgi:exodeoxyribonuclease VII small subunit